MRSYSTTHREDLQAPTSSSGIHYTYLIKILITLNMEHLKLYKTQKNQEKGLSSLWYVFGLLYQSRSPSFLVKRQQLWSLPGSRLLSHVDALKIVTPLLLFIYAPAAGSCVDGRHHLWTNASVVENTGVSAASNLEQV
jgi:hypothetical protein